MKRTHNKFWGPLLAGGLILAFPALALAAQNHRLTTGTSLKLNVESLEIDNTGFVPKLLISTPLHRISTSRLTGDNSFVVNDQVFVFMSPGPNNIWYPYAISKRPPEPHCQEDNCLVLKGQVTDIARDSLKLSYAFDTAVLPGISPIGLEQMGDVGIQVAANGHSTLKTITFGDQEFDQRNLFNWAP